MSGRGREKKRGEHHNKQRVSVGGSERNEGASAVGMTSIPGKNDLAANVTAQPTSPVSSRHEHIIPSSIIGLLLCHHNDQSQSSLCLNTIQNLPINVRETMNVDKLLAYQTEEQRKENIFWKLLNTASHGDNPLGGKTKFVFALIGPVERDHVETGRQFFVDSMKEGNVNINSQGKKCISN